MAYKNVQRENLKRRNERTWAGSNHFWDRAKKKKKKKKERKFSSFHLSDRWSGGQQSVWSPLALETHTYIHACTDPFFHYSYLFRKLVTGLKEPTTNRQTKKKLTEGLGTISWIQIRFDRKNLSSSIVKAGKTAHVSLVHYDNQFRPKKLVWRVTKSILSRQGIHN